MVWKMGGVVDMNTRVEDGVSISMANTLWHP
jgi:hypothetical protein